MAKKLTNAVVRAGKKFLFSSDEKRYKENRKKAAQKAAQTRKRNREQAAQENPELENLRQELRRVAKIVNSRARRLRDYREVTGHNPPALDELENSGGNIKLPKTEPEVLRELLRAQIFMNDPTSTVKGAREFFEDIADIEDRWWIYKRLREIDPTIDTIKGKFTDTMNEIDDRIEMQRYSKEEILDYMIGWLQEYDEARAEAFAESQEFIS